MSTKKSSPLLDSIFFINPFIGHYLWQVPPTSLISDLWSDVAEIIWSLESLWSIQNPIVIWLAHCLQSIKSLCCTVSLVVWNWNWRWMEKYVFLFVWWDVILTKSGLFYTFMVPKVWERSYGIYRVSSSRSQTGEVNIRRQ